MASFTVFDTTAGDKLLPLFTNAGAPSDGTSGTLAGVAIKGALIVDTTNGVLYQNTNTLASPTWSATTTAGAITATTLVGSTTTDASSSTTGAFKTAGGMGIAKKLYVGTALSVGATLTLLDIGNTISAAGTTRADATALTKQFNNLTTVAASTAGVILPASALGMPIFVWNNGANAVHVYGAGSDTIDGVAGTTGVVLTNAKSAIFYPIAANTYLSMMGVKSA